MGLERVAAVLQGVDNLYEIDTSRMILDRASDLTGAVYGRDAGADVRLRVVADHVRTAVMMIGDGITPANEGRGYVLRRIVRRAVRAMRLLGTQDPTMRELVTTTIEAMGPQYAELVTDSARVHAVAEAEEASFLETISRGVTIFDTSVPEAKAAGGMLSGQKAFALHDTFGFPIDLTLEMAAEAGLSVDEQGFRALMDEQRQRAKADSKAKKTGHVDVSAYRGLLDAAGATAFTGYAEVVSESVVRGPARRRDQRERGGGGQQRRAGPGPHAVLRRGRWAARRPGPDRARERRGRRGARRPAQPARARRAQGAGAVR